MSQKPEDLLRKFGETLKRPGVNTALGVITATSVVITGLVWFISSQQMNKPSARKGT